MQYVILGFKQDAISGLTQDVILGFTQDAILGFTQGVILGFMQDDDDICEMRDVVWNARCIMQF